MLRQRRSSQALGQLRWMIDRGRQTRWRGFISARQKVRRLQIIPKLWRKIRHHDCTRMRRAETVRARTLVVVRNRLRSQCFTMSLTQVSDRIEGDVADEKQHGKQRGATQKCIVTLPLHCR